MKISTKKLIVGLVVLAIFLITVVNIAFAETAYPDYTTYKDPDSGVTFVIEEGEYAFVTGYVGDSGDLIIPDTVVADGVSYPVQTIGSGSFINNTMLTSLVLSDNVEYIGDRAFWGCKNLTSVSFPSNIKHIGADAFCGCSSLLTVEIQEQESIDINSGAFCNCDGLISAKISGNIINIYDSVFTGCSNLAFLEISGNIIDIKDGAVYNCMGLVFTEISGNSISIGNGAYEHCRNLVTAKITGNITKIDDYAFFFCPKLSNIFFWANQPEIFGEEVFAISAENFTLYYHVTKSDSWSDYQTHPSKPFCVLTLDPQDSNILLDDEIAIIQDNGCIDPIAAPDRDGYIFSGWYKEKACQNVFDFATEIVTDDITLYAKWDTDEPGIDPDEPQDPGADPGTRPVYTVLPAADAAYNISPGEIKSMTINPGHNGPKYFTVNVSPVVTHEGDETVVFTHLRDNIQLTIAATKADFDLIGKATAGFNVLTGDVVKVFVLDDLSNAKNFNPTIYQ